LHPRCHSSFLHPPAHTALDTLSLHDALPIFQRRAGGEQRSLGLQKVDVESVDRSRCRAEAHKHAEWLDAIERSRERRLADAVIRSEEHTSELQSPDHLVCRLLLEKKKTRHIK